MHIYLGAYFVATFPLWKTVYKIAICPNTACAANKYGSVYTAFCGDCGTKVEKKDQESWERIPAHLVVSTKLKTTLMGDRAVDRTQQHFWAPCADGVENEAALVSQAVEDECVLPADDILPFSQMSKLLDVYKKDFEKLTEAYRNAARFPAVGKVSLGWGLLVFDA